MIAAWCAWVALGVLGDLTALERQLKDPSEKTRRSALLELVAEGSSAAWALVLDALGDPSPMVADEAEIQLAKLEDAALLKELAGRKGIGAGDDWVRRRAAEVYGRMQREFDAAPLVHALSDKNAEVRRMATWSLERAERSGVLAPKSAKGAVVALASTQRNDKDPQVRAAALRALGAFRALEEKDQPRDAAPESTCARLQCEVEQHGAAALPLLNQSRTAVLLPVRCEVAIQLAELRSRAAVELLIAMLSEEHNLRLSWRISSELTELTGVHDERNAQAWSTWLRAQPEDWSPAPVRTSEPQRKKPGLETTSCGFMGMPVLSDHLAILVDLSGSISKPRADGKTRKQVLDAELERTLRAFGKDVWFNLIPYTGDPLPWEKRLAEATPSNVETALSYFRGLRDTGKGNVWAAFELAFSDPDVDTVLLFSDGAPTGGQRWNLDLMRELFAERNRFRHIVLDAVIVDAKKGIQEDWRRMCEESGGRMLPVEMK